MCVYVLVSLTGNFSLQDSDGEKSEDNLVVDVSNEVCVCENMLFGDRNDRSTDKLADILSDCYHSDSSPL